MTDERPNPRKLIGITFVLIAVLALYVINFVWFADPPEEPEGIIVRFILFFKQGNFI